MRLTNLKILLLKDDKPAYQIAAKCGIHHSTMSDYALGKKTISPKHLRALTKYFKCRQTDILGTSDLGLEVEVSDAP